METTATTVTPTNRKIRNIKKPECVLHLETTNNNFFATLSDLKGCVLYNYTAGRIFNGRKKSTPHAANIVTENLIQWCKGNSVTSLHIFVKGIGMGSEVSYKSIMNSGLIIKQLRNITGVKHGGCKARKAPRN